ncbi:MAG: carbamoyl-phosphate synthase (glutamine-hydrolyzing) large subunit [Myxococcales bacterium]|nr:carbamoyl-phosphate synthase (glutamine-hydrolyzing) large subunit [Myxococcales bacterium]
MFGQYLPKKPRRVLVLGSGALKIGEAGEFDYSGSQAIKAFREEGITTILVNPNIATIQTSEEMADKVYFLPVDPHFVEEVIVKEEVDAITCSFGGQTALNCGVALDDSGVLAKYGVRVLGTPIETVRDTEDRLRFKRKLDEIGVKTARSAACTSPEEVNEAVKRIGLPVILRGAYSLGGKGSRICDTQAELDDALLRAFSGGTTQVLVEESLRGWKEIEYEVVRDARDNCITVCNMENVDPLGIHTGESIVVAPSQTLNDEEYQKLRTIAIKTIRHLGVVGECNIQYALDPRSWDYRVIEVNARLSRSSALASKATGYPLAYVAAKIALGYALNDLPNAITRRTSAFFEPALDYIVCKFPRWDLQKFRAVETRIGSEMKSVGEVMAIGKTFAEVLQKATRMLEIGVTGLDPAAFAFDDLVHEIRNPSPRRIFAVARCLAEGMSVEAVHGHTGIDPWFLEQIAEMMRCRASLAARPEPLDEASMREAKQLGFSDRAIALLQGSDEAAVRAHRSALGVLPKLCQIDTLAAEYPAETNYLYFSHHASADDVPASWRKKVLVLGGGAYRIGSSVEFDWCCVNTVKAAQELGYETLLLNYNPETVSTDYDVCDKLIFDEISLETVLDLWHREAPVGVVVSMGGQVPNNLALRLDQAGVKVLGTAPEAIDRAEDRKKFSDLLDALHIDQPRWMSTADTREAELEGLVETLGGYPVLVRPSYVLSGAAMTVAHQTSHLANYLQRAASVSPEHPVVVTKFETHAKEIEIDAVADRGEIVLWALSEHIENAGVHSGDATLVLPPQKLYIETVRRIRRIARDVARALAITGPFNMQFLAKDNVVKVIECNLRASRSFPFVSKVTGVNFIREAARRMLGVATPVACESLDLDYVAVKAAQFSFSRLAGADPTLGVEMASTGEVGCLGDDLHEALLKALLATGMRVPKKGVLLSLGPVADKYRFEREAQLLAQLGLTLYATPGTLDVLREQGIDAKVAYKDSEAREPSAVSLLSRGEIDLVINIPRSYDREGRPDGYRIRRRAVDLNVPLLTNLQLARAFVEAIARYKVEDLKPLDWASYLARNTQ